MGVGVHGAAGGCRYDYCYALDRYFLLVCRLLHQMKLATQKAGYILAEERHYRNVLMLTTNEYNETVMIIACSKGYVCCLMYSHYVLTTVLLVFLCMVLVLLVLQMDIIQTLVSHDVSINTALAGNATPLGTGLTYSLHTFLTTDITLLFSEKPNYDCTVFAVAAIHNDRVEVLEHLLSKGADTTVAASNGWIPLHLGTGSTTRAHNTLITTTQQH